MKTIEIRHCGARASRIKGMALVAVLWLMTVLAFAALTAVKLLSFDLDVADAQINGFKARQAAEMGIAIGANPVVRRDDPMLQALSEEGFGYQVQLRSEGERFNINYMLLNANDKNLVKQIFLNLGVEEELAQEVADALFDWVDPNDEKQLNGAEREHYENLGRINQPFNRPFYSLEEMRLVRGMDVIEQMKPDWRDWFTVWSAGGLDINEASAEKIALAAECELEDANSLVEIVRGPDGIRGTDDDAPFSSLNGGQGGVSVFQILGVAEFYAPIVSQRLAVNDSTTRIESMGQSGDSKRKIVLVMRNRTGRPTILEKTEEVVP